MSVFALPLADRLPLIQLIATGSSFFDLANQATDFHLHNFYKFLW